MKLNVNQLKQIPSHIGFGFAQYGELNQEIKQWVDYWNFETKKVGPYTNIYLSETTNLYDCFQIPNQYEYIDGFSPNLNKNLHIGHLSNLVIANSFQKLGIGKNFISILGDTLETGNVDKDTALKNFKSYCKGFGYSIDKIFFASEMKLKDDSLLVNGSGEYKTTKVFQIKDEKIVGVKSNGKTSYFYQDVALAQHLNDSTLYLTGFEQDNHFKSLETLFPKVNHLGLGLVMLNGEKMSSSKGNVLYLNDFISELLPKFNNDIKLVYNILAGQILQSQPNQIKSIDSKLILNPKQSLGLYLSYTMAKIKSCGVDVVDIKNYKSQELQLAEIKSITNLSPNILFKELVESAKKINKLYEELYIKDNSENIELFSELLSDLKLGMTKLGMFEIEKV